jgi:sugar O-acyltransferase (sialic acid O-acetyltransferase NeuD family)
VQRRSYRAGDRTEVQRIGAASRPIVAGSRPIVAGSRPIVAGSRPIVIVGAGGHGRELVGVLDDLAAAGAQPRWRLLGLIDDAEPDPAVLHRIEVPYLGGSDRLAAFAGAWFVVGIGDGCTRHRLDRRAVEAGLRPATLIHPDATIGRDVRMAPGVVVCAHVSVTTNVDLGRHVHLNRHAAVGHDSVLADHVTVHPAAMVSGAVRLGEGVTIGAGAAVIQGRTVGEHTMVGAGAVVIRDLPPGTTAVGSPARPRPDRPRHPTCR